MKITTITDYFLIPRVCKTLSRVNDDPYTTEVILIPVISFTGFFLIVITYGIVFLVTTGEISFFSFVGIGGIAFLAVASAMVTGTVLVGLVAIAVVDSTCFLVGWINVGTVLGGMQGDYCFISVTIKYGNTDGKNVSK